MNDFEAPALDQPNGTKEASDLTAEANKAHAEKIKARADALLEVGTCARCRQIHPAPRLRWKCSGCDGLICWNATMKGDDFGRKGQNIHTLISAIPGKPNAVRVCGTLTRMDELVPKEADETDPENPGTGTDGSPTS